MGEVFNLTPGKATNENDTLAERAAEQLGEAAALLHDQQSRSARKEKTKGQRKTKPTKGKKKGKPKTEKDSHSGRRVGDSFWEDPDETPRKSLAGLFDGSGGSTPQTRSSKEEPNTDDREFIKGDGEPLSDPSYHPTDEESDWCSGLESPFQETKIDKPIPGGAWINDADGDAVWVPEDIGGGGPGGIRLRVSLGTGAGRGQPTRQKGRKERNRARKKRRRQRKMTCRRGHRRAMATTRRRRLVQAGQEEVPLVGPVHPRLMARAATATMPVKTAAAARAATATKATIAAMAARPAKNWRA